MSLLITLALLTWASFLNWVCGCIFINIMDTQFCVWACQQQWCIKRKTKKCFLKSLAPVTEVLSLLRVLTKFCSLTLDELLFKSFPFLWAEAGFCFIQSDVSLSQDSLIKSVSWLKRGRNEPIHQPRNAVVWPLPKATGKGRNLFNLWGGWQWVMHSWRHGKWKPLWTFAVIKFKIGIKESLARQWGRG